MIHKCVFGCVPFFGVILYVSMAFDWPIEVTQQSNTIYPIASSKLRIHLRLTKQIEPPKEPFHARTHTSAHCSMY